MTFEEWSVTQARASAEEIFAAGAASRDAEVAMLRDVLDDKQWAKDGDVHAHNKRVQEALDATKPKGIPE